MKASDDYPALVLPHYQKVWGANVAERRLLRGPTHELPRGFRVLEFEPTAVFAPWVYATSGMSPAPGADGVRLELHLYSPQADESLVELLTVITHYHATAPRLGLHHTVNFGRPWLRGSACDRGFISLPYPHGPSLQWLDLGTSSVECLWLIPVTPAEVEYKQANGAEALEVVFEQRQFNYLDPARPSVC